MPADFSTHDAQARFPVTHRSAVMAVGSDDPVERARSFELLVRAYWKPVYKHLRVRWNRAPEDASDLTQGFFAKAFEKRHLATYDPQKALFRTYLRTCLDRFVMDVARGEQREKRGGGLVRLSLDFEHAEKEMRHLGTPVAGNIEAYFDAEWTRSLLASAVEALEASCLERGKAIYFAVFQKFVIGTDATLGGNPRPKPSYADIARELDLSVSDVTNYLAWARREFRTLALSKLREITSTEDEYRMEARAVFGVDV